MPSVGSCTPVATFARSNVPRNQRLCGRTGTYDKPMRGAPVMPYRWFFSTPPPSGVEEAALDVALKLQRVFDSSSAEAFRCEKSVTKLPRSFS